MDELKPSYLFFFAVWVVTIFFRLFELRLAKQNLAKRIAEPNLQITKEPFFFLFVLLHTSFLIAVPAEILGFNRGFDLRLGMICFLVYTICLIMRISILTTLRENWNVKVVYDPHSQKSIAKIGLYKYIRHPNYLVVILEIAAISLLHQAYYSLIFFSLCNFCLLFFRIRQEEAALMQNPYYAEHFRDKKRFIPFLF